MLKKLLLLSLVVTASNSYADEGQIPLDTYFAKACVWLLSKPTPAKTAVTAAIAYSVAYSLFQTAKGLGTSVWTWWKGENLSPDMKRQVECYLAELIKRSELDKKPALTKKTEVAIKSAPKVADKPAPKKSAAPKLATNVEPAPKKAAAAKHATNVEKVTPKAKVDTDSVVVHRIRL